MKLIVRMIAEAGGGDGSVLSLYYDSVLWSCILVLYHLCITDYGSALSPISNVLNDPGLQTRLQCQNCLTHRLRHWSVNEAKG